MQSNSSQLMKEFLCGLIAGFTSVSICHPLDVIRTRMNIMSSNIKHPQRKNYATIGSTIRAIWKEEGFKGFYRGYSITVISIPFFNSIYFPIYHYAKKYVKEELKLGKTFQAVLGALVSGFVSNTLTNPIWVMRTRYMVEVFHPPENQMVDLSMISAYRRMIQAEGYKSLFKGWVSSMFGILHAVVYFPIYENLKVLLSDGDQANIKSWQVLLASIAAKITASVTTYPHIVIRTVMQDERREGRSLSRLIKNIYKHNGIRGFYMGLRPDLIRILPSNAIVFLVYQHLKKNFM